MFDDPKTVQSLADQTINGDVPPLDKAAVQALDELDGRGSGLRGSAAAKVLGKLPPNLRRLADDRLTSIALVRLKVSYIEKTRFFFFNKRTEHAVVAACDRDHKEVVALEAASITKDQDHSAHMDQVAKLGELCGLPAERHDLHHKQLIEIEPLRRASFVAVVLAGIFTAIQLMGCSPWFAIIFVPLLYGRSLVLASRVEPYPAKHKKCVRGLNVMVCGGQIIPALLLMVALGFGTLTYLATDSALLSLVIVLSQVALSAVLFVMLTAALAAKKLRTWPVARKG